MIELWQGLVLALIQGLTEFLPISSSAHLLLPSRVLGWPDQGLAFDVGVHVGTLVAVMLYFRDDLLGMLRGGIEAVIKRQQNDTSREILYLALATLPALGAGFALNSHMDALRTLPVIATTTIVFGLLLGFADKRASAEPSEAVSSFKVALLIGLAQAIAPLPGTSRSGITITAGLLLGLSRQAAARFSFLLSIPIILGAGLLKSLDLLTQDTVTDWTVLLLGTLVAGISAYLCIAAFLRLIDRVGMMPFVWYRLLLGVLLCALIFR